MGGNEEKEKVVLLEQPGRKASGQGTSAAGQRSWEPGSVRETSVLEGPGLIALVSKASSRPSPCSAGALVCDQHSWTPGVTVTAREPRRFTE